MGSCRGLSLLLGAAAAGWPAGAFWPALGGAATMVVYVAALTTIAEGETLEQPAGPIRWLPVLALCSAFAVFRTTFTFGASREASLSFGVFAIFALLWAWHCGERLSGRVPARQRQFIVGELIRGLLLIQGAFCAVLYPWGAALGILLTVLWLVFPLLARRFASS